LIAQAIGRWGNWFNHELFGRPTTLPWGLQIPASDRPVGYSQFETFHPTFLYESLWCLLCALLILAIPRIRQLQPGNTFLLYISLYCLGRVGIESLRIDFSHRILGLRFNEWVALLGLVISAVFIYRRESLAGKIGNEADII